MSFRTLKLELQGFVPELNAVQCGLRLNRAYQHLLDMHPWSFLNVETLLKVYGPYTTGTADVTLGSTSVTGTSTAWTTAHIGWYFKCSNSFVFYKITNVDALTQTLTLESTYGEANGSAQPYTLFKHVYNKPTDCANIIGIRYEYNLPEATEAYINTVDPDRSSTGEPYRWFNASNTTIEIWPVPDQAYSLRILYRRTISDMTGEGDTCLIPERCVLLYARLTAYQQLATRAEGQAYVQVLERAQKDFDDAWASAVEEDMRRISLPMTVAAVDRDLTPTNNDWNMRHDATDPRRFY